MSNQYEKEWRRRYDEKLDRMSDLEFAEYSLRFEIGRMWFCLAFLILTGAGWFFLPNESGRHIMLALCVFTAFCMCCGVCLIQMDKKNLATLKSFKNNPSRDIRITGFPTPNHPYGIAIDSNRDGTLKCAGVAGVRIHGFIDDKGNQEMTIYWQCVKCNHQLTFTGPNYDQEPCPKCGERTANLNFGSKPNWWKS